MTLLYKKKMAVTSPANCGRSIGIVCSRAQVTEFFFIVVYLPWHDFAMEPTASVHQICANIGESAAETLAMIRQAFREGSMISRRKVPNSPRSKKARQLKGQSEDQRQGLDQDFAPNIGDRRTGCCIKTTHRLTLSSSAGNVCCPQRTLRSCFPDWR
jgi:hypothetical protein